MNQKDIRGTQHAKKNTESLETTSCVQEGHGSLGRRRTHHGEKKLMEKTQKDFGDAQQTTDPWRYKSSPNKTGQKRDKKSMERDATAGRTHRVERSQCKNRSIKSLKRRGTGESTRRGRHGRRGSRVRRIIERQNTETEKTSIRKGGRTRETNNSSETNSFRNGSRLNKGHRDKKRKMNNHTEEAKNAAATAIEVQHDKNGMNGEPSAYPAGT